jgi:glutamine amidotransferase
MSVAIIDYGMCNLGSVRRAFEECGAEVRLTNDPADLDCADQIVLPGVGAFAKGMANLHSHGWVDAIRKNVGEKQKPLLGICLGMQLLASFGDEGGGTEGLGLIDGKVIRLRPTSSQMRVPHVGWNEVLFAGQNVLFDSIPEHTDFYFVHSFHFEIKNPDQALAKTPYCGEFVSAVARDNVWGVQFHPEKSQKPGFQLIKNFLKQC